MFGTLLESRARRERAGKGAVVSVVVHAGLIVLAVAATAAAGTGPIDHEERVVSITPPVTEIADPPPPRPPDEVPTGPVAPDAVGGAPILVPPIDVPDALPAIDATAAETRAEDFARGARRAGELPAGTAAPGADGTPILAFQADKPVVAVGGCAPRFPDVLRSANVEGEVLALLRSANVEGEVLAQFVVDAEGRADASTFKVLKSSHELFAAAVKSCLPSMRFIPAEAGGRRVSQIVQQPFVFALDRR
jgi:periplasmic protein TonB